MIIFCSNLDEELYSCDYSVLHFSSFLLCPVLIVLYGYLLGWLEGVIGVCVMPIYTHLLYRLALLQEWREGCGQIATYRKLANKSFYNAGKPGLVETVCAAIT